MKNFCGKAAIILALLSAGAVQAGTIGTATVNDVTLGGSAASYLSYASGVNPQKGPNGASLGFSQAFSAYGTGSWSAIAKFTQSADGVSRTANINGSVLTIYFDQTTTTNGNWSFTNNDAENDVTLDLVFALHTGGGSGAWLFDNKVTPSGATIEGTWKLNLLNNGGRIGDFSNLTVFTRNYSASPKLMSNPDSSGAVPEPATLASMMLGLGVLALTRRRSARR